jgi:hypothetical protein
MELASFAEWLQIQSGGSSDVENAKINASVALHKQQEKIGKRATDMRITQDLWSGGV